MKEKILMLFCLSIICLYSNDNEILQKAISKLDYDKSLLRYEAVSTQFGGDNKKVTKVEYNPLNKDPFTLISINNEPPTDDDIEKYNKQRSKNSTMNAVDYLGDTFDKVSKEGNIIHFKFLTKKGLIPIIPSKFPGNIWIDIKSEEVRKIDIIVDKRRHFFPGVYLDRLYIRFYFQAYNDEITILKHMDLFFEGKIFSRLIHQKVKSNLYNYREAGN